MEETVSSKRYFEAVGRRKTSVARVRLVTAKKNEFIVNDKTLDSYFPTEELQDIVREPFTRSKMSEKFMMSAKIKGGGVHSQSEALRHGIARALVLYDINLRPGIKKSGLLSRDPRAKERRKFGKKKARKSPQWSKR